jgi:hypothetical protein
MAAPYRGKGLPAVKLSRREDHGYGESGELPANLGFAFCSKVSVRAAVVARNRAHLGIWVCLLPYGFRLGRGCVSGGLEGAQGVVHAASWRRRLALWASCLLDIACADSVHSCWRLALAVRRSDVPGGRRERVGRLLALLAKKKGHGVDCAARETLQWQQRPITHAFGLR